ncbi:MAG: methyltransferase domain-containing protein [Victivallaceae bacterium]|nr:methyltransferase domain-containing protein [Victivallaceae bacterium]
MNKPTTKTNTGISTEIIILAISGLELWENKDLTIDDFLDSEQVEQSDLRRTISSILFSYFRNKPLIDALIKKFAKKVRGRDRRIIAIATVQMLFQDAISAESAVNVAVDLAKERFGKRTAGFINAVLRKINQTDIEQFRSTLPEWASTALPEKLYNHWQQIFSKTEFAELLAKLHQEPRLFFRQCRELNQDEIGCCDALQITNLPWLNDFKFYSCTNPGALLAKNWLKRGHIYIQDPATAMSISLIDFTVNIQRAIDLCAAPGGKSLMIAENLAPDAKLIAADRSVKRQQLTRENLFNHGFSKHEVVVTSATDNLFDQKSFDLVFLDVPCSNTGVFRRRPDAMWNWSEQKTAELVKLQQEILTASSKLLKPGGQLIYSTCTIDPAENQQLVASFIKDNPEFKLIKEQTLLPGKNNDGAYAARIDLC